VEFIVALHAFYTEVLGLVVKDDARYNTTARWLTAVPRPRGSRREFGGQVTEDASAEPAGHTLLAVAYDEKLADRIRELIAGERRLTEQRMFGGLAFLVDGNMAIAASGQGGVLVRVDPEAIDDLVAKTAATVAVMRGRPMRGWLRVPPEHLRTKRQLSKWVHHGATYARSLPAKRKR
jgi:TfoX/Sxy family transcriptional regulator of competence genes